MKFLGAPLDIPAATADNHAVRKIYVDQLGARVTSLESGGSGMTLKVRSVSANTTAAAADFVLANASSAAVAITLPTAPATNTLVGVKKVDTGTNLVTVLPAGSSTIDGDANLQLLSSQAAAVLIYDGTNWQVQSTVIYDLGARNLTFRGTWSSSVAYSTNDVVEYQGSGYVAYSDNTNVTPGTAPATWGVLVSGATVTAGTTTTGAAGTNASVTNSGTNTSAVFNFTIPRGADGAAGAAGAAGSAATVAVGTTTTGAAGSNASVTNSGSSSAAVFNFTVPRGAAGVGFTYKGTYSNSTAYAINDVVYYSGSSYVAVAAVPANSGNTPSTESSFWNLIAFKGTDGATGATGATGAAGSAGAAATVAVGTTTTGAAGSNASVTNSGSSSAAVFNFTVPAGATGPAGSWQGIYLTGNTTALNNQFYLADTSVVPTNITVTLPASPTAGFLVGIKKIDSGINTVTVTPASGTIDGDASIILSAKDADVVLLYVNSAWRVLSAYSRAPLTTQTFTSDVTTAAAGTFYIGNGNGTAVNLSAALAAANPGKSITVKCNTAYGYNGVYGSIESTAIAYANAWRIRSNGGAATFTSDGSTWQVTSQTRGIQYRMDNRTAGVPLEYSVTGSGLGTWHTNMTVYSNVVGGTFTITQNYIYYVPLYLPRPGRLNGLGVEITAAAANGVIRLGLYTVARDSMVPDVLVAELGSLSTASTGTVYTDTLNTNFFNEGWHYIALGYNATATNATLRCVPAGTTPNFGGNWASTAGPAFNNLVSLLARDNGAQGAYSTPAPAPNIVYQGTTLYTPLVYWRANSPG